ncbi:MAG: response regulator [Formivibrio sp.]|nr:response regulator [Formivibrio sp.]
MRLLLVEDDVMIGTSVQTALQRKGFVVDWVRDGIAAETALIGHDFDLMLLDLGLPRQEGGTVLANLRARHDSTPVLILSARDTVADRVKGLNTGADDYLVKPFDLDELVARIHALLRRHAGRADPTIKLGNITIDPIAKSVLLDGVPVALSARELALLMALSDHPGAVLSVTQLQEKIYGWDDEVGSNTVEVYIHGLRKKLGAGLIRNVRGVGYVISKELHDHE